MKCQYRPAYYDNCDADAEVLVRGEPDLYICKKHDVRCSRCNQQAVQECEDTYQFVCGFPLCAKCKCPVCEDRHKRLGILDVEFSNPIEENARSDSERPSTKYLS